MSSLHIIYDMKKKTFVGGSVGGKHLEGIASVTLSNGSVSVKDYEGRVLLGQPTLVSDETDTLFLSEEALSKTQADIAREFGLATDDSEEE